jgi:L-threonylcarbamoyladenylate synthase
MLNSHAIVEKLRLGKVGVLATDTLYGLVARAEDRSAVERLYVVKQRRPEKPLIILMASFKDVERFGITLTSELAHQLKSYWPGRVSVVVACNRPEWTYLHRGTNTLAFRVPAKTSLRRMLRRTGPLVAPSANPEGMPPARTITQAEKYFGNQVDFYRRGLTVEQPSRLIKIEGEKVIILR